LLFGMWKEGVFYNFLAENGEKSET